jgi:DNA-binding CsgD family transcriptional regulator
MERPEGITLHWSEEQEIYHRLYSLIFAPGCPVVATGHTAFGNLNELRETLTLDTPDILMVGCKDLTMSIIQEVYQIHHEFGVTGLILLASNIKYEDFSFIHACLGKNKKPFALFLKKSVTRSEQYYSIVSLVKMGQVVIDPGLTNLVTTQKDKAALAGGLTTREMEILDLIAKGLTNIAISQALDIDVKTVRHHINNIYSKLQTVGYIDRRHPRVNAANSFLRLTGQVSLEEGVLE